MLRATNVPWRDLIKSIAYGVTVIQGDDIKWPLVRHVHCRYIIKYHSMLKQK